MAGIELKPCPFCGGKAVIVCFDMTDENGDDHETYSAECRGCGICTPFTYRENAEELWNRRAEDENKI